MADNIIQQFSKQKPGPISETWKCIFAMEKRLQYNCNTEDNFRRKLTELEIKKIGKRISKSWIWAFEKSKIKKNS